MCSVQVGEGAVCVFQALQSERSETEVHQGYEESIQKGVGYNGLQVTNPVV